MASIPSKSDVRGSAGNVAAGVDEVAHDAAQTANSHLDSAGNGVGDLYGRGADGAREALNEMPTALSDIAAASERLVLRGRQTLHHSVRKQPVEAFMLAGAIGYLVGWAASRG